jgi:hypothetical protein
MSDLPERIWVDSFGWFEQGKVEPEFEQRTEYMKVTSGIKQVGWYWMEGESTDEYGSLFQGFEDNPKSIKWFTDHKWKPMFVAESSPTAVVFEPTAVVFEPTCGYCGGFQRMKPPITFECYDKHATLTPTAEVPIPTVEEIYNVLEKCRESEWIESNKEYAWHGFAKAIHALLTNGRSGV